MSFSNSALESYGVATDSQLPESMEAFAAMLSKSAYAAQAFEGREPGGTINQAQATPFRLFEILPTPTGTVLRRSCHEEQDPQP